MTTDTAVDDWHWVDVEGRTRRASRQEIVALLGGGRIARQTLVWRNGWQQWMPAGQVAELAEASEEGVSTAFVPPRLDPRVVEPPALPATRANVNAGTSRRAPPRIVMRPTPAAGTPAPVAARPALRRRPATPTLIDGEPAPPAGTLRPPVAVPPPPRGVPSLSSLSHMEIVVPGLDRHDAVATPVPAPRADLVEPRRAQGQTPETIDGDKAYLSSQPATQVGLRADAAQREALIETRGDGIQKPTLPESTLASATYEQPPSSPAPTAHDNKTNGVSVRSLVDAASPPDSRPLQTSSGPAQMPQSGLTRALVPYVALGVAAGLLGATAVGLLSHRQQTKASAKSAKPVVAMATPSPAPPPEGPCVLGRSAQRLSPAAMLSVPLNVGTDPASGYAALGFADSTKGAMGIVVDPESLMVRHVFRAPSGAPTVEVTPLAASGHLDFAVTRKDADLQLSRPVDTVEHFVIGFRGQDFESVSGATRESIWQGAYASNATNPRVASVPSVGHAVTFRSGGQQGQILFGWLTDVGRPKTTFRPIAIKGLVGTPTLAANDRGVLIVFAARADAKQSWHVELALSDFGAAPAHSVSFALPPGGPGQEAISPVVAGLPDGRWLLQWTEGPPGHRDVRLQTLTHDLEPLGAPVTVSPKRSNAGQGAVWVHGTAALAAFLVSSPYVHELWGATLRCP